MKDLAMEIIVKVYMEVVTLSQVIPESILQKNPKHRLPPLTKYKGDEDIETCIPFQET